MKKIITMVLVCLWCSIMGSSSVYAVKGGEDYQRAFFDERKKMLETCNKEKINLLEDYADWVLPRLQKREKKVWSYSANGSNVARQSSCQSAASCDSILERFNSCITQAASCTSMIPKAEDNQSCSVLLCYERKVQCMGDVVTDYAACVRSKSQ